MSRYYKILSQNIIFISLVIGIIIAVNYLSSKDSKRFDLTEDKEYTLSKSTLKVLNRLEDRLTIKIFISKDMPAVLNPLIERIEDVLNEYKANSKHDIVIENVIADLNDDKAKDTKMLGITPFQINVQEKDKLEIKNIYLGMALFYQDKQQIIPIVTKVNNLEYILDLSVLKLTQKKLPKIGIYIGGNAERYQLISQVINEIGETKEIKSDTSHLEDLDLEALLIVNPVGLKREFLEKIDALQKEGTTVLIFASTVDVDEALKASMNNSGMDEWLAEKGVGISQELLLDAKQNVQLGFQAGMIQVYKNYPFWVRVQSEDLDKKNIITAGIEDLVLPWSNTVELYGSKDNPWDVATLIKSSQTSFLEPSSGAVPDVSVDYIENLTQMPVFGKTPISVMLTHKTTDAQSKEQGKLFVTANAHMIEDTLLQQYQSNVVFLSNLLEYSTWGDYLIDIRSRGKSLRPLKEMTYSQKNFIKWGLTILTPISAIIIGLVFIYWSRMRREKLIRTLFPSANP